MWTRLCLLMFSITSLQLLLRVQLLNPVLRASHQEAEEEEEEGWRAPQRRGRLTAVGRKPFGGFGAVCTIASRPASTLSPVRARPDTVALNDTAPPLILPICSSSTRPDVRAVDDAGVPGVELERVAHPSPLGLSLPDPRQHLLLAADRLPVRLHLHHGHHRLPASAAVCPWRGHRGESRDSRSHQIQ